MNQPIGIFDSGIGGLTVLRELCQQLPYEDFVYFGDTARVPYGTKSKPVITRFSIENTVFLLQYRIKALVVACNTASSLALPSLKKMFYTIPIFDVITPAVEYAGQITKKGRIGVIGTKATIASSIYQKYLHQMNPRFRVFSQYCPLFVPLVEEGWTKGKIVQDIVLHYVKGLRTARIDTLILGCTHYPILKEMIQEVMGNNVTLIDSGHITAQKVQVVLRQRNMCANRTRQGKPSYYVSDSPEQFMRLGTQFLHQRVERVKVVR